MKLHQLLRIIHNGTNISIYNLKGVPIVSVRDKDTISTELYDYDVLEVTTIIREEKNKQAMLVITIQM